MAAKKTSSSRKAAAPEPDAAPEPPAAPQADSLSWLPKVFSFVTEFFTLLKANSVEELEKVKRRVVHYAIVYGLLAVALLFIAVGGIKHLAYLGILPEGLGFILLGCGTVVLLALYSLLRRA